MTARLRVLQFSYGESLYGAERWVLTLIKYLDPELIETVVAAIRDTDTEHLPLVEAAREQGFETAVIDGRRHLIHSSVRGLRDLTRDLEIDVVHTHGGRQDIVALLARRRRRFRLLATPHGWEATGTVKSRTFDYVNKWCYLGFDAVAPLSAGLVEDLKCVPLPGRKIELIPNGVDLDEVHGAAPVEGLLPKQRAESDFVIGFIGRLIPGKGCSVLLRALEKLPPSGWCGVIIGEGPLRGELEREAARRGLRDRVEFMGFRPDRLAYLKRIDAFVLPSYREGIPRSMMEAMAAGALCIGSKIPGIEATIEAGESGETFPVGDPDALAALLRRHLHDRGAARRLIANAHRRAARLYSARAMAASYEELYFRLCGRRITRREVAVSGPSRGVE